MNRDSSRRRVRLIVLVAVVVLMAITFTTAFRIRESDKVHNRFTFAPGEEEVAAELTEPSWDAQGEDLAGRTIPGIEIPKDPIVTNTGTTTDIWTAVKVTFVYSEHHSQSGEPLSLADYSRLMDILDIDWNLTDWELAEEEHPYLVFYYRSTLMRAPDDGTDPPQGEQTSPLFTRVKVPGSATTEQMKQLQDMGGFCIEVEGFAVQAQEGEVYSDFREWGLEGGVYFGEE